MGVIYKLKPEIIAFIVEEKKRNRLLSCRLLAQIVEQKFQKKVSKSSINAIFQQYQLSNHVGRSSHFKAPKNFFIPQEKKALLKEKVSPFLKEVGCQNFDRENKKQDNENYFEDAGEILLRIVLWGLSQEAVLGGLLKSWAGPLNEKKLSLYEWEEIVFESSFRREDAKKIFFPKQHLLYLEEIFQNKQMTMAQEIEWGSTIQSLLMFAEKVKIISKNGKVFYFDSQLKFILLKENKASLRPVYRVIEDVVDCIINQVRPLKLFIKNTDEEIKKQLEIVFDHKEDSIQKIEILDQQDVVLNEYVFIPEQKRNITFCDVKESSLLLQDMKSFLIKDTNFCLRNKTIIENVHFFIKKVLKAHYLSDDILIGKLLKSSGYIKQTSTETVVQIILKTIEQEERNNIERMMNQINIQDIFDREGRRIYISLI